MSRTYKRFHQFTWLRCRQKKPKKRHTKKIVGFVGKKMNKIRRTIKRINRYKNTPKESRLRKIRLVYLLKELYLPYKFLIRMV